MQYSGGGLPHQGKFLDLRGPSKRSLPPKQRADHPALTLIAGKTMLPLELQLEIQRRQAGQRRYQEPQTIFWTSQAPPWLVHPLRFLRHPLAGLKAWLRSFQGRFSWQLPLLGPYDLKVRLSYVGSTVLVALLVPVLAVFGQGLKVKNNLFALSSDALASLTQAGLSLKQSQATQARASFNLAYQAFFQAGAQLSSLGQLTLSIAQNLPLVSNQLDTAQGLIELGKSIAQLGESLAQALEGFQNLGLTKNLAPANSQPITSLLAEIQANLDRASKALHQARVSLGRLKHLGLPPEIQQGVREFQAQLPLLEAAANEGGAFLKFFLGVLGEDNPKRYLILFENNSELRPGGGFIGSLAELDVFQGKVRKLEVKGVYQLDGQLTEKVIPPRPLQRITPNWGLRDSNWFLDFAQDAQLASWFYERVGRGTPDGVIAITPTVVEEILRITGPIEFPQYQMSLNADNFRPLIQQHTEFEYDRGINEPKKILADFTPLLLEKVAALNPEQSAKVLAVLVRGLETKQILLWFQDESLQAYVEKQNWGGRVKASPQDYLAVVHSNIAGYKTDQVIEDKIDYQVELTPGGRLKAILRLTRSHHGASSPYVFYNYQNRDYIKVYVPKGSQLLRTSGATIRSYWARVDYDKEKGWLKLPALEQFDRTFRVDPKTGTHIFEESGKTVFGNWLFTEPGRSSTLTLEYLLPFDFSAQGPQTYSLLVQKQPGTKPAMLMVRFQGENLNPTWGYPEGLVTSPDGFSYVGSLNTDRFFGFSFTR